MRSLEKMRNRVVCFVVFLALILIIPSRSELISFNPQPLTSFNINKTQSPSSCNYAVTITTSCSSPQYTRDQISLSYGDAYGYQVYAPRIEDPSTGTFEQCSVDTYDISGPCLYQVCYLYLYRTGYDGWVPESVRVCGYYTGCATFYYNTYIPSDIWYGFNYCGDGSASARAMKWFWHVAQVVFCFQFSKGLFGSA